MWLPDALARRVRGTARAAAARGTPMAAATVGRLRRCRRRCRRGHGLDLVAEWSLRRSRGTTTQLQLRGHRRIAALLGWSLRQQGLVRRVLCRERFGPLAQQELG